MEVDKMVLGTLGMLAAAAGIAGWADKSSKNAYPAMKDRQIKKDFEAECARYGVKGRTNKFTDLQIEICNRSPRGDTPSCVSPPAAYASRQSAWLPPPMPCGAWRPWLSNSR